MASRYDHDGLSACAAGEQHCRLASRRSRHSPRRFDAIVNLTQLAQPHSRRRSASPLAAPLLLELENGTYRLAWTQGITRRRWLDRQARHGGARGRARCARDDRARDVVADAARPPPRPHGATSSTSRAPWASGTCSSRSGSVARHRRRLAAYGARADRRLRRLRGRADLRPELAARALRDAAHDHLARARGLRRIRSSTRPGSSSCVRAIVWGTRSRHR